MARPAGFRPGAYRGRGSGIISRSGRRAATMEDAGGLSGLHRLMNRNRALELELQRVTGMLPHSLVISPGCGVDGNQSLEMLLRSKGGTQAVRDNATVGKEQESAVVACAANPPDDDRVFESDFLPLVAGVGLDEYINAALSARAGSSKSKNYGNGKSLRNLEATTVPTVASDDPFPPLSRLSAGAMGHVGDSASSRHSHGADQSHLHGDEPAGLENAAGGVNKFSWKDLVRSSKPDNICVDLHYVKPTIIDGEACAVFTLEEETENLMQWQNTLLCYVVGKSPSYYQFLKAMQRQWNPDGGLEMFTRENGIFFCKFGNETDMKRVIKEGPWYMDGKLVVVKKFTGETNCEEEMLSSIPIWVKLPCLPVQWWSIEGVSKVVSPLGHPLYFDLPSASRSRIVYARCCVEVAMEKNLPSSGLCVGGDKVKKRQAITYDWVPKRCSLCKEFGHVIAECGSSQSRQQHEKSGWINNNKKMGKGQQSYIPKTNNQTMEVEGQLEANAQKDGDAIGKEKQKTKIGGSNGTIYKTNLISNRKEAIKASSANAYQLLAGMEEDDAGIKFDGGNKGNHIYFCSDVEEDDVDGLASRTEAQMKNKVDEEVITMVDAMELSAMPLVTDPCNEVEPVVVAGISADNDPRERETRGAGKEIDLDTPKN